MSGIPYRTSLRVLGRLLNGDKARMATICEVDDGFLLYYCAHGDPRRVGSRAIHSAEVLDLDDLFYSQRGKPEPTGSLKGLQSVFGFRQSEALKFQKSHPLCPMGYENFLRALGDALDRRHAQAALIQELDGSVHVEYTIDRADFVMRDGQRLALPGRREEHYTAKTIDLLVQKGREQTAEKVRRNGQNLTYNPLDVATYLDTAQTLEDDGHLGEAENLYRKAAQLAPTLADAHSGLARLARRRGDRKGAFKALQQAIDLDPANGSLLHLLGRLQAERGRHEAAAAALEQAVALEPGNRLYRFDLSRAYERMGQPEKADAILAPRESVAETRSAAMGGPLIAFSGLDEQPTAQNDERTVVPFRREAREGDTAPFPRQSGEPAVPLTVPTAGPAPELVSAATSLPQSSSRAARQPASLPADQPEPAAPRSRIAAALAGYVEDAAPHATTPTPAPSAAPANDPPATAATPFAAEAPSWDGVLSTQPPASAALPGRTDQPTVGMADMTPQPSAPEHTGLPVLGLSLSDDWSLPSLPVVHVPSDGAAAAAALPLAVPTGGEGRRAKGESDAARIAEGGDSTGTGTAGGNGRMTVHGAPAVDEEAVHLAAAIMRAEDLVRAEPHRADLHRKLGFLLAKQGRSEEAAAEFRRAAECGRRRLTE